MAVVKVVPCSVLRISHSTMVLLVTVISMLCPQLIPTSNISTWGLTTTRRNYTTRHGRATAPTDCMTVVVSSVADISTTVVWITRKYACMAAMCAMPSSAAVRLLPSVVVSSMPAVRTTLFVRCKVSIKPVIQTLNCLKVMCTVTSSAEAADTTT